MPWAGTPQGGSELLSKVTFNDPRDVSRNSPLLLLLSFQLDRERSSDPLPLAGRPGGLCPGEGAREAVRAAPAVPQAEAAVPEGAGAGGDAAGRDPPGDPGVPVPVPQRALELQPGGPAQPAQERYKVVGVRGNLAAAPGMSQIKSNAEQREAAKGACRELCFTQQWELGSLGPFTTK